jgi:uncharacterized protein YcaQ
VQADPIRAPARAQDLTLRHRVSGYRASELERRYAELPIEEDHFVNYGFLPRRHVPLMHPRTGWPVWDRTMRRRARAVLDFVKAQGEAHPREVDARFAHGRVTNAWGGSSSATTHLLEGMHYRGLLRVRRREAGVRVYAPALVDLARVSGEGRRSQADALVALAVSKYAPVPAWGVKWLASRLRRVAAPQLAREIEAALGRALVAWPRASVDGVDWYWPPGEDPGRPARDVDRGALLLAPFDPVVWDRRRFEVLWGWAYRFEAYTPVSKRTRGYYALPLLWRDDVVGWGNLVTTSDGALDVHLGYVAGRPPRDRGFSRALDAEIERFRAFLGPP